MLKPVHGEVVSNFDGTQSGRISAQFDEISDTPIEVFYASPMFREGGGGLFAVPEKGDRIIAFYDTISGQAYYNSTIVGSSTVKEKPVPGFKPVPGLSNYSVYQKPVKVKFENQKGAGLCITSEFTSFDFGLNPDRAQDVKVPPRIVDSVVLTSPLNKRISLDDSPKTDAIFIKNQHKDGIIISGDSTDTFPAQMIQVKSSGPHNYTCMQSHMDIRVVEGTDITIENNSTGKMAQRPEESTWPNRNTANTQPPKRFGGIYLRSENGDVSVASKAEDGRVFITTPNAQIQIVESTENQGSSDIIIKTNGKISMEGEAGIDMRATNGSIRLQAAGDIDVTAGGLLKTSSSDKTSISSGGDTAIQGSNILLNSGGTEAPVPASIEDPLLNDYRD